MPLLLTAVLLCQAPPEGSPPDTAKAETPREEFLRIGKELYENENPFIGAGPRRELEKKLEDPGLEDVKRVDLLIQLGKEYLKGTDVDRAIATMESAVQLAAGRESPELRLRMHRQLALAYLRKAEQVNCVRRHNSDCCIFPLQGGAIHQDRGPAEKSREHYLAVLE